MIINLYLRFLLFGGGFLIFEGSIRFNHVVHMPCVNIGGREWDGGSFFYLLLALGLGATIEKEHAVPRGG